MVPSARSLAARNFLLAVLFFYVAFAEAEAAGRWLQAMTPSPTVGAASDDPERYPTPSVTPTPSSTPDPSATQTQTATASPSLTPPAATSVTSTATATPTFTETAEAIPTSTSTSTASPTITPAPTSTQRDDDTPAGSVIINEVLIRPHYDWEGKGGVTTGDEIIELFNRGPGDVWLRGWFLDDVCGSGSKPFALPGVTISKHGYAVFFRSKTHIALNDGGDSVRLLAPDGRMIDKLHYERVRAYNLSYGRLPNGSNELVYGLWPTPGEVNMLFIEPGAEEPLWPARPAYACPDGGNLRSLLPRLARNPWHPRWMFSLGLTFCD